MVPTRVYHYSDPAAAILGLNELRRQGLTPRGLLFIALDPRGEIYIAVPDDLDVVTRVRVGDKLTLKPPLEGRYFHFDAVHRLPGDSVLWNGDRRLGDAGTAQELASGIAHWLKGNSAKNVFLGCTPHQPGSWWARSDNTTTTALHASGFVDTVVAASGLIARRIGEPHLYYLDFARLGQETLHDGWERVYTTQVGNVLLLERRVINYRLALTCEQGIVEVDISGLPDVRASIRVEVPPGVGLVGRFDGGAFAMTRGEIEPWGFAKQEPATLYGAPNDTMEDLARLLREEPPGDAE